MVEGEMVSVLKDIREELKVLRRLTEIQLRGAFKEELEKIASSPQRKKMWALADGTRSTTDVAKMIGTTQRAVQYFVQEAERNSFMRSDRRGFPMRLIDWIPPDWESIQKEKSINLETRKEQDQNA